MANLVWVHGSGYTEDSFRAQTEAFPDSDALSLPGHPEGEALTSVGACTDWLARYLGWKRGGKAVVGGNSLGGAIAMEWALRYPGDAAGLILIGTGARLRVSPQIFELIDEHWPQSIDTLADFALGSAAPPQLREQVKAWHQTVGQRSTRRDYAMCNEFDIMGHVDEIMAPTLIIVGSEDRLTPPKFARYLQEKIAGSELLEVAGAGHLVMAEKPGEVNAAIRRKFGL